MAAVTSAASAAAARIGAALSDAQYFESSMVRVEDIRRQLDSRHVKEKLDAMKRVIALISLGKDASTFFPDVVKNVAAPSLDVKKLVYLYLVHYAEQKQDLALLAINSFQKDLSDHNQHIRALSLRVLSSIRVKVILQVVIMAISRAAKDSSAYVRNAAAHAIGKVCALEPSSKESLLQPLQDLVADRSTHVMGSAIAAYEHVCPYKWSIIHPHYRRICSSLPAVHPWGQIAILGMLLRYARTHFSKPTSTRNDDLTLLIDSTAPLFHSLNNAVVASTVALYYHLATEAEFCERAVKPLLRLVSIEDDGGQAVALTMAAAVAARFPPVLIPYLTEFNISPAHSTMIAKFRMQVLTKICETAGRDGGIGSKPNARKMLLTELKSYLHRREDFLAAASARAIGCLATAHPASTPAIVKVLSSVVQSAGNPSVVAESIGVLRRLLQRHPSAQARALPQLIVMLLSTENDSIVEPAARASIIWLIAEFYEKVQTVATEALRLLAKGFASEHPDVKLQILNLAAKVVACSELGDEDTVSLRVRHQLLEYVVSCARYDQDYDVRDKARMFSVLFMKKASPRLYKSACKAFLSKKPTPVAVEHVTDLDDELEVDVVIGSMAHVLKGRRLPGFRPLEPWAAEDSDSALREEVVGSGVGAAVTREYTGMGSADYQMSGSMSSAKTSSVWEPPAALSAMLSSNREPTVAAPPKQMIHDSITSNADPESFYADQPGGGEVGGEEDDDDEYTTDDDEYETDEDESEEEVVQQHVAASRTPASVSTSKPVHTGDLLSDILTPSNESNSQRVAPKKPTSEFDLDALLGGMTVSPPVPGNKPAAPTINQPTSLTSTIAASLSQSTTGSGTDKSVRSAWERILESWNCGGHAS